MDSRRSKSTSVLVYKPLINFVVYARAVFLTAPQTVIFGPSDGETRFPYSYRAGIPTAKSFRLVCYENQADADALDNPITDASKIPTARFIPDVPVGTKGEDVEQGVVFLTAPAGYDLNTICTIEMVQDLGERIKPHIYVLQNRIEIPAPAVKMKDYAIRYWKGDPPAVKFLIEWYETELDALLQVRRLTDTDRLPRHLFIPSEPNQDAEPDERQDGVLRLYPSEHANPYTSAVALLCLGLSEEGTPDKQEVNPLKKKGRKTLIPNWER